MINFVTISTLRYTSYTKLKIVCISFKKRKKKQRSFHKRSFDYGETYVIVSVKIERKFSKAWHRSEARENSLISNGGESVSQRHEREEDEEEDKGKRRVRMYAVFEAAGTRIAVLATRLGTKIHPPDDIQ